MVIKHNSMKWARLGQAGLVVAITIALGVLVPGAVLAQTDVPAPSAPVGPGFGLRTGQNQPGSEEMSAGRNAAIRSNWQEALDQFRAVLDSYPDSDLADDAMYWRARSLQGLGRYADAVVAANEMIVAYPRSRLLDDARIVRFESAEILVSQGSANYERYLRDEVGPRVPQADAPRPPQPTRAPRDGRAPQAPPSAAAPRPAAAPQAAAESDLRVMALDALIGMDPEAAWPILQRLVGDSEAPELRSRAVWLLSQLDTDEAFDLLLTMARTDPDPEVKNQALFWLGQSSGHAEEVIDLLIDMVNNATDEDSAGQALFGLGQSSDPRARQALESLVRDANKPAELRASALFWLGQQGDSLQLLGDVALNDPDEEMRGQALFGISQIDSAEASDFLLQIATSDAPVEVRSNAIFWLGQREDERAVEILIGLWGEVDDIEIRNQILFGLAQTNTEVAIDHLIAVATDDNEEAELRQQAVFWLGQSQHPKAVQALLDIIGGGTFGAL